MGRLTDDMTQLRGNIDASRESRLVQQNARVSSVSKQIADFAATRASDAARDGRVRAAFVTDNANDINRLLNDFRHTRQITGQQDREARAAFVAEISKRTGELLAGFNVERKDMAERSAKGRADFISNMTNSVATFIKDAAHDRAGAHAAFFGVATSKKKNDIPRIAIQFTNEPLAEKQETAPIPPMVEDSVQSEQPEHVSSFSPPEDLAKLETFSEPDTKGSETRRSRRRQHEHTENK